MTNFIVDRMQDQSYVVREAAGETCGRFSEFLIGDFLNLHAKVLPALVRLLKDLAQSKKDMTIQKALFALNEFVKDLEYDIKYYLDDCIPLLLAYINNTQFSRDVRYWALFALSSTIGIAEKRIIPYQDQLIKALSDIVHADQGTSENQNVKGQALMCIGKLASSCGRERFPEEAISVFTNFALSCLNEKDNKLELRETAFNFFSDLSYLIKEGIQPIFEQILTEILKSCKEDAEMIEVKNQKETSNKFSLDSDSEEEIAGMDVDVGQLDEKTAAVAALGFISKNAPNCAKTKMPVILETLEGLQFHFHENVKFHVCLSYTQIALGMMKQEGMMNDEDKFEWKKGAPANSPLPEVVVLFINHTMMPYYFRLFDEEEDKTVIERALANMQGMCEDLGPAAFEHSIQKVVEYIVSFLDKKTFC